MNLSPYSGNPNNGYARKARRTPAGVNSDGRHIVAMGMRGGAVMISGRDSPTIPVCSGNILTKNGFPFKRLNPTWSILGASLDLIEEN